MQRDDLETPESLAIQNAITTGANVDERQLTTFARYVVTARVPEAGDEGEPVYVIESVWALAYELEPNTPAPSQLDAEAFAAVSGVMAVHPYVREHVGRLTAQMGYEGLVLDVVRVPYDVGPDDDFDMPLSAEHPTPGEDATQEATV